MERRREADKDVSDVRGRLARIEWSLLQQAVQQLERLTGSARYRLAAAMLGFASERDAMDFAARRRVPTWVPEALRDRSRKAALAAHFGQAAFWSPLRVEYERAMAARSAMGEAPVRHVLHAAG